MYNFFLVFKLIFQSNSLILVQNGKFATCFQKDISLTKPDGDFECNWALDRTLSIKLSLNYTRVT